MALSTHTMRVICIAILTVLPTIFAREVVNFDFAWRHKLGPSGAPRNGNCSSAEVGYNWGTGGYQLDTSSASACCDACAADATCGCWDFVTSSNACYVKTNCSTKVNESGRITGKVAVAPQPTNPPEALPGFDDSSWELVNAPHDMLIEQPYDPANTEKMAFIARNVGWYRKKFSIPSDWKGSTIYLYIEGAYHVSTWWINGVNITTHKQGYTSFWLRLDNVEGLTYGTDAHNEVAVFMDASFGSGWWYEGGGLIRHNHLVRVDPVHIVPFGTWVHTNNSGTDGATFITETTLENFGTAASATVKASILDVDGNVVGTSTSPSVQLTPNVQSAPVIASVTVSSGVKRWTVQAPNLYTTAIEVIVDGVVVDTYNMTTGVRVVRFDADQGMFLDDKHIKMRGFCDHSNFGGVGGAMPDRLNLFRAQKLRSIGANAWRMAHNPPSIARLDYMDALGMVALDENRDYGGNQGQGGDSQETVSEELVDMSDLIKRDRSHPSVVFWSFCNEVGCKNETAAKAFRAISKLWDPTRAVTQNDFGSEVSGQYLDVQGFSHAHQSVFESFHKSNPTKPQCATECCSCMSQRGVDEDFCPNPKDGGCAAPSKVPNGTFYNNNIGTCTAEQVLYSDSLEYQSGTFVWSGFDYLGEARGWPQNTKCRGTVSDNSGFTKETAYWLKSVWLSNISKSDAGRPLGVSGDTNTTVFIIESWLPPMSGTTRSIHVYSNAPAIRLELNGKNVGEQTIPYFGMANFDSVTFETGNLTAIAVDGQGNAMGASHSITTTGVAARLEISIDAPSVSTGTGSAVVADGEDIAMIRTTIVDEHGLTVPRSNNNITFSIISGAGSIWSTHNGDPANDSPSHAPWTPSYHGLARAIIRSTADQSTPAWHRRRLLQIDVEGSKTMTVMSPDDNTDPEPIIIEAVAAGLPPVRISIPVTNDLSQLPMAVARQMGLNQQQLSQ
eukprot:m.58192 g.58192  ORF g.58192 m.58192 type:complete len:953 (+) comp22513_c0_seq2:99-2957(+)